MEKKLKIRYFLFGGLCMTIISCIVFIPMLLTANSKAQGIYNDVRVCVDDEDCYNVNAFVAADDVNRYLSDDMVYLPVSAIEELLESMGIYVNWDGESGFFLLESEGFDSSYGTDDDEIDDEIDEEDVGINIP